MDLMTDGKVFKAGTLNANRVAMAAAHATLEILEEGNGEVYKRIYTVGEKLMNGMKVRNYNDFCQSSKEIFFDFRTRLLPRGVYIRPAHFGELYLSAAHTEEDIDRTLEAADEVIREMKRDKVI